MSESMMASQGGGLATSFVRDSLVADFLTAAVEVVTIQESPIQKGITS